MDYFSDSTDRSAGDYLLFAFACVGFLVAALGIIVSSPWGAFCGALLLVLCIAAFRLRPGRDE